MTERYIDLEAELQDPELDLITDYLAKELPPEQIAAVTRRLQEDQGFAERWAPLVAAWHARPALPVISDEEVAASWERVRERAGLLPTPPGAPPRRRRWLTIITSVVFVLMAGWIAFGDALLETAGRKVAVGLMDVVPDSGKWMTLLGGTQVLLDSGVVLKVAPSMGGGVLAMHLEGNGTARFRPGDDDPSVRHDAMILVGRAGVASARGDFLIRMHEDTTWVETSAREGEPADSSRLVTVQDTRGTTRRLQPGERVRMIRSQQLIADRNPVPTGYTELVDSGHVMRVANGATVRLGTGAKLWVEDVTEPAVRRRVWLEGIAFFSVRPVSGQPAGAFAVETRGAHIKASNGEFQVTTNGDTTELAAGKPGATAFDRTPATVGQVVYLSAWGARGRTLAALVGDRLLAVRGKGALPLVRARVDTHPAPPPAVQAGSGTPRQPTYTSVIERPGAPPETLAVSYGGPAPAPLAAVRSIDPATFAMAAGVARLAEGVFALSDSGARVTAVEVPPPEPMHAVRFMGGATFVVVPERQAGATPARTLLVVTRGGIVTSMGGVMKIEARGDTTECEVLALAPGADSLRPRATQIVIVGPPEPEMAELGSLILAPGMRARIVRGQKPEKLPARP